MRLLHIASFIGNVGDILSNFALQDYLYRCFGRNIKIDRLEIRRFHKNAPVDWMLDFDTVIEYAARHYDRILIGGGGFLDYWVPRSGTGATIDISPKIIEKLKTRLVISSVGAYPHHDVPYENFERFSTFIAALQASPEVRLMFRNDGSVENLARVFGAEFAAGLRADGDHCYLLEYPALLADTLYQRPYVVLNVAPDQLSMNSHLHGLIDGDRFYEYLSKALLTVAEVYCCDLVFVPHLPQDCNAVLRLTEMLPDAFVRERLKVFQFDGTENTVSPVVSVYKRSIANISARLHSNILSIVLDQPTVSLDVLDRVTAISRQHSKSELVCCFDNDFSEDVVQSVETSRHTLADGTASCIRDYIENFLVNALA